MVRQCTLRRSGTQAKSECSFFPHHLLWPPICICQCPHFARLPYDVEEQPDPPRDWPIQHFLNPCVRLQLHQITCLQRPCFLPLVTICFVLPSFLLLHFDLHKLGKPGNGAVPRCSIRARPYLKGVRVRTENQTVAVVVHGDANSLRGEADEIAGRGCFSCYVACRPLHSFLVGGVPHGVKVEDVAVNLDLVPVVSAQSLPQHGRKRSAHLLFLKVDVRLTHSERHRVPPFIPC